MAKSWNQFMKNLETRAKSAGPEHVQILRALRGHYRKMGAELAQERKKLGLSQEGLARATGIDQAEISRIERDLVDPRLGTYVRLLEGMGLGLRVEPLSRGRLEKPRQVSARRRRG
jgi:DNA-binding XRE family transcriptional regulator